MIRAARSSYSSTTRRTSLPSVKPLRKLSLSPSRLSQMTGYGVWISTEHIRTRKGEIKRLYLLASRLPTLGIADGWIYDRVMICSFISFLFLSLLLPKASTPGRVHHAVHGRFEG
ncbi:hypothetical protein SCHPADRAFT_193048 [Schizopora paradoxa]|uniref:Uncharacterized protein n=1 Tax=Schizopora paradoxa TaxID=27342 RepID=A0A0H2RY34_9AGAM|nr:hypothetical protein SCHPADRAFT_193048 [Schizopora paradoxa]